MVIANAVKAITSAVKKDIEVIPVTISREILKDCIKLIKVVNFNKDDVSKEAATAFLGAIDSIIDSRGKCVSFKKTAKKLDKKVEQLEKLKTVDADMTVKLGETKSLIVSSRRSVSR